MKRILLAGVLAGLTMFVWAFVSHMLLPIGTMGISVLPNEAAVMSAMKASIGEPGLYFFPYEGAEGTEAEVKAFTERYQAGPRGVLIYHPDGADPLDPRSLVGELIFNILAALVAGWIISRVPGGTGDRAWYVALFGLIGWMSISASEWLWYGFPFDFVLGVLIDQLIGWFLVGMVLAKMIKAPARA